MCTLGPASSAPERLIELVEQGSVDPLVGDVLPLDQAPDAYGHFDARDEGWTKVLLKPGQAA